MSRCLILPVPVVFLLLALTDLKLDFNFSINIRKFFSHNSPSKTPDLGGGEAAGCTGLFLDMEGNLAAPPAQSVRLVAPHSKG